MNASVDSSSREVCLVDDDASVLRSMQYLLASDGIKVRAFNKPEEFLAHAAANPVPVVVTDIWMEGDNRPGNPRANVCDLAAPSRHRHYRAR